MRKDQVSINTLQVDGESYTLTVALKQTFLTITSLLFLLKMNSLLILT